MSARLPERVAVLVVRDGVLPLGADEAVAEADGHALVAGSRAAAGARELVAARRVWTADSGTSPAALSVALAPLLAAVRIVILPASPDGRDLAPRLAAELGRPLLASALEVLPHGADVLRLGGSALVELTVDGPFVATLEPGVRGAVPVPGPVETGELTLSAPAPAVPDAVHVADLDTSADAGDLAAARRVLGAGGGLGGPEAVALLAEAGAALDMAVGGTRVVTDAGWLEYARQIGTTGVTVDPDLYVAFGVSGAPHHTGGLGAPRHVVSVNTDPYCPMTAMADLGIVADAPAVLAALTRRLREVGDAA
ncbi:mycofactocin-associated electron transfer flavoprotein alpha subunit [Streptomyces sp. NBC_00557]|uniref:mycofactocin-associated electron transfer flavoprotein alpha subunit n=1 Tax=Streptomyces sp. NBC_00557 TaxID=2975776 RepID=UPI002E810BCC|nr:mycofactocin-associated electron transfer flavoprotein alpha subunit [Streptomyces sp. NBC_00557]WUC40203.1 mycofactocin-associated electron transfer flavoprotein alpha subunit [Streptomyces sp. NBC_00557]